MSSVPLYFIIKHAIKQWLCKHEQFHENGRCDAICSRCRKNLGFIGRVREQRASLETGRTSSGLKHQTHQQRKDKQ